MKFPKHFLSSLRRGAALGLLVALVVGGARCSTSEPPVTAQMQPSLPGASPAPGVLGGEAPAPGDTSGLPGPEPLSTPPENEGPGATETNFLTPPCRGDGDCPGGRRCVIDARAPGDAGAAASAGSAADASDGGLESDAGAALGRCERPDAG